MTYLEYPTTPHVRRHSPSGYTNYKTYKDWLRDDFCFRCVYCLIRERWYPNGSHSFSADHLIPKSIRPDLACDYNNLIYSCIRCNTARGINRIPDPCAAPLGLEVRLTGEVVSTSGDAGDRLIEIFNLNDRRLVEYRQFVIDSIEEAKRDRKETKLDFLLGYPSNMPNLTRRTKCVNANSGSERNCYFLQKAHERLATRY